MRVLNKKHPLLRLPAGLLLLSLLAACSSGGFLGDGKAPASTNGKTARMPNDIRNAICQGHAEDAIAILTAEPLASPSDRFFMALATEQAGHPARARMIYAQLMQSGAPDKVKVRCGNQLLADGTVSGEAAKRLAEVARNLAVHDANLRPTPPLHRGLPPATAITVASGNNGAIQPTGPAMNVNRPASQSPFGQWFVHLASYRSIENATKNKGTIERQFPALADIIDQWEVDVGGLAVRLGIRLNDRSEATNLCNAVKSQGAYCAVIDASN